MRHRICIKVDKIVDWFDCGCVNWPGPFIFIGEGGLNPNTSRIPRDPTQISQFISDSTTPDSPVQPHWIVRPVAPDSPVHATGLSGGASQCGPAQLGAQDMPPCLLVKVTN